MATTNEFDIFEPDVFQAMVDAIEPPRELYFTNRIPKDMTTQPFVQWSVREGKAQTLALLNTPNSKANVVPGEPVRQNPGFASLAYMREGDYFLPTTMQLLKDIENGRPEAIVPAQRQVADRVAAVVGRIDNRVEWLLSQALQGSITYTGYQTGPLSIDYGFKDTHKVTLSSADQWSANPSVASLIKTLRSANSVIQRDGGVPVTDVFLTRQTMDLLVQAWTDAAVADGQRGMLTDTMLNQYYSTGEISGFMGAGTWKIIEQYYDEIQPDGSVKVVPFIPHGTVIFANLNSGNPIKMVTGPSFDMEAPLGRPGRWSKVWDVKDPSEKRFLVEQSGLPVIERPDNFLVAKVASQDWVDAQIW